MNEEQLWTAERFSLRLELPRGIMVSVISVSLLIVSPLSSRAEEDWEQGFRTPPPECRPEVYWDWMGGLISKEGITKDIESLARAGVGGVLIMQLPDQLAGVVQWPFRDYPGKVKCLSDEWFAMMNHAAKETDRMGLRMSFLMCPGWSHCGGPWINAAKSLKVLVASRTPVAGSRRFDASLPRAPIHKPRGMDRALPGSSEAEFWERFVNPRDDFYRDVAVVAVPVAGKGEAVPPERIVDLTKQMDGEGRLVWDVPPGRWTVVRLGVASQNGPNHPAPPEAMGFECDRMDPAAVRAVFDGMTARIVKEARAKGYKSVQRFETDSYEAGNQDFGLDFQAEFVKRRGYECTPRLPAWLDRNLVIGNRDLCERFRADMLRTISELWIERFYGELRRLADENDLQWMIEPYFLMNHDWRTAAARAQLPGGEFWMGGSQLIGPAPDIAALYGHKTVWAEAFTAESYDSAWRNDPWRMKCYGDAGFCQGINHLIMHGFTHHPWDDRIQPGLTMGFWGTQMNRYATWWPYSADWHRYLARCHFLLQRGQPVADVLAYPPRAEHIPGPVLDAGAYRQTVLNDETLLERLAVRKGRIVSPHGTSYAALALAPAQPLRPEALQKLVDLVRDGATLIGSRPPARSASLEDYPDCDHEVARLIDELWGTSNQPGEGSRKVGDGQVIADRPLPQALDNITGGPDFVGRHLNLPPFNQNPFPNPHVRFVHRRSGGTEIYFVSNQEDRVLEISADFRVARKQPELWDPVSGAIRPLAEFRTRGQRTAVPLRLEPRQSCFVIFRKPAGDPVPDPEPNFPTARQLLQFTGPWKVSFDTKWGGPEQITFDALADWTQRAEPGIQYYSGAATYQKRFDLPTGQDDGAQRYLDLGTVKNLARVRLNDQDLGVVWCAPWRVRITDAVKAAGNRLEITVVNTWVNRLIGDEREPDDSELVLWDPPTRKGGYARHIPGRGLKDLPDWVLRGTARPSAGRYTFSSWRYYPKDAPLQPSGLLGPVTVLEIGGVSAK
ncbi:MAG: glycosyl hydrolase [Planctomycetota bacterium]|jgi:hypothetical protein